MGIILKMQIGRGALCAAALLSLSFGLLPSAVNSASLPAQRIELSSYDLIAEVNALRASNGLAAYNVHPILMQIAQSHVNYQAATGSTTHYGADGSRPFQRALAAGYSVAGDLSLGGFFSENIIAGSNLSPEAAVAAWSGDAPHLNTMLSPNLQDVGAGVATSGGLTYYTLDAGLASGSPVSYTPPAGAIVGTPGTAIVSQFMLPVEVSTPLGSGAVYHEVQFGQTLWSIAIAYDTTVEQIKSFNNLTGIDIYEGQKLVVKHVPTPAPSPSRTVSPTARSGSASSTVVAPILSSATTTPIPAAPTTPRTGGAVVLAIIVTALLGAGLGTWISLRRPAQGA